MSQFRECLCPCKQPLQALLCNKMSAKKKHSVFHVSLHRSRQTKNVQSFPIVIFLKKRLSALSIWHCWVSCHINFFLTFSFRTSVSSQLTHGGAPLYELCTFVFAAPKGRVLVWSQTGYTLVWTRECCCCCCCFF